jgi:hypothetical protein
MKANVIKEKVRDLILYDSVDLEEYQNKFYLAKNLKTLFPDLPEDFIYKAIESTNRSINPPRKKDKYINLLINKLLNFNAGY